MMMRAIQNSVLYKKGDIAKLIRDDGVGTLHVELNGKEIVVLKSNWEEAIDEEIVVKDKIDDPDQ